MTPRDSGDANSESNMWGISRLSGGRIPNASSRSSRSLPQKPSTCKGLAKFFFFAKLALLSLSSFRKTSIVLNHSNHVNPAFTIFNGSKRPPRHGAGIGLHPHPSILTSFSRTATIASIDRPTRGSHTDIHRTTPSGSTKNVPRNATCSFGCSTP